jgi:hypothetical protein
MAQIKEGSCGIRLRGETQRKIKKKLTAPFKSVLLNLSMRDSEIPGILLHLPETRNRAFQNLNSTA